jgi:hypothetical protein
VAHVTEEAKLGAAASVYAPTRVFLKKRLQGVENKGRELQNNGKEAANH